MPDRFKSTWVPVPRSPTESWKQAVSYEVGMLPDELDDFGVALKRKFPGGIIYVAPMHPPPKWESAAQPIQDNVEFSVKGKRFDSFMEAGLATNQAHALFRFPWPDEFETGDKDSMLNDREAIGRGSHQDYRRMGRCFQISWSGRNTEFSPHRFREHRDSGETLDCEFRFITSSIKISIHYDAEDAEVVSFLHDVENVLLQNTTCDFASYDPCTHEIINPNRQDATQRRSLGMVRYASLNDHTYFGWCHRNGRPPEVMGPRPEVRAAFRREAGLEP